MRYCLIPSEASLAANECVRPPLALSPAVPQQVDSPADLRETASSTALAWYALRVKPCHEKAVAGALRYKGFEEFLPLYKERRRWSDRIKEIESPLFPNYTFCRFADTNRLAVVRVPGVLGVVKFGNALAEVNPEEIDAVRAVVGSGRMLRPCEFLAIGQRVRIVTGPLSNLEGVLQRFGGSNQLVVSVSILQRSVSVELERDTILPVPARRSFVAGVSSG